MSINSNHQKLEDTIEDNHKPNALFGDNSGSTAGNKPYFNEMTKWFKKYPNTRAYFWNTDVDASPNCSKILAEGTSPASTGWTDLSNVIKHIISNKIHTTCGTITILTDGEIDLSHLNKCIDILVNFKQSPNFEWSAKVQVVVAFQRRQETFNTIPTVFGVLGSKLVEDVVFYDLKNESAEVFSNKIFDLNVSLEEVFKMGFVDFYNASAILSNMLNTRANTSEKFNSLRQNFVKLINNYKKENSLATCVDFSNKPLDQKLYEEFLKKEAPPTNDEVAKKFLALFDKFSREKNLVITFITSKNDVKMPPQNSLSSLPPAAPPVTSNVFDVVDSVEDDDDDVTTVFVEKLADDKYIQVLSETDESFEHKLTAICKEGSCSICSNIQPRTYFVEKVGPLDYVQVLNPTNKSFEHTVTRLCHTDSCEICSNVRTFSLLDAVTLDEAACVPMCLYLLKTKTHIPQPIDDVIRSLDKNYPMLSFMFNDTAANKLVYEGPSRFNVLSDANFSLLDPRTENRCCILVLKPPGSSWTNDEIKHNLTVLKYLFGKNDVHELACLLANWFFIKISPTNDFETIFIWICDFIKVLCLEIVYDTDKDIKLTVAMKLFLKYYLKSDVLSKIFETIGIEAKFPPSNCVNAIVSNLNSKSNGSLEVLLARYKLCSVFTGKNKYLLEKSNVVFLSESLENVSFNTDFCVSDRVKKSRFYQNAINWLAEQNDMMKKFAKKENLSLFEIEYTFNQTNLQETKKVVCALPPRLAQQALGYCGGLIKEMVEALSPYGTEWSFDTDRDIKERGKLDPKTGVSESNGRIQALKKNFPEEHPFLSIFKLIVDCILDNNNQFPELADFINFVYKKTILNKSTFNYVQDNKICRRSFLDDEKTPIKYTLAPRVIEECATIYFEYLEEVLKEPSILSSWATLNMAIKRKKLI